MRAKYLWIVIVVAAVLMLAPGALAQSEGKTVWTVSGYTAISQPIDIEQLNSRTVQLDLQSASVGDAAPVIQFQCQNVESGEMGTAALEPLASSRIADSWQLELKLDGLWMNMPYPVDPGALESKPMAIIAQRSDQSPFSMEAAQLRLEFARTAAYMLETARHHYQMPYGDGLLNCAFMTDSSSPSDTLAVRFGRGLPATVYARDFSRPDMSAWPTWVLGADFDPQIALPPPDDSNVTRGELDLLLAQQAERTPEQIAAIRRWDNGSAVGPWIEITLDSIIRHTSNPPRAARALALVSAAMNDALVAASRIGSERSAPCALEPHIKPKGGDCNVNSAISEHALVATAASTVLTYLFPDEADLFAQWVDEASMTGLWAGTDYRSGIDEGIALGERVAQIVIARAEADGSSAKWDGSVPAFAQWLPTPPEFQANPLEPLAGTWRVWNLTSGSQFRPPPPPEPGSPEFEAEAREVYVVTHPLGLDFQQIASYWEDKKGSYTPPGHWNVIALRLARADGLSTAETAQLFAALNTAQADAFIAAWDTKYAYWSMRPVTAIQQLIDPNWNPYIYTPPFPSYVSGHSTTSGAASTVLAYFFPEQATQLEQWAQEAAVSRLYGGIHFRSDNEVGLRLGQQVGHEALVRLGG